MQKWRHYLLGNEFVIRTDHCSLKNLLGQVIQWPEQQYFLTRLLEFSFTIVYKRGKENVATDPLSRLPAIEGEGESTQFSKLTSIFRTGWAEHMNRENQSNLWIHDVSAKVATGDFDLDFEVEAFYITGTDSTWDPLQNSTLEF